MALLRKSAGYLLTMHVRSFMVLSTPTLQTNSPGLRQTCSIVHCNIPAPPACCTWLVRPSTRFKWEGQNACTTTKHGHMYTAAAAGVAGSAFGGRQNSQLAARAHAPAAVDREVHIPESWFDEELQEDDSTLEAAGSSQKLQRTEIILPAPTNVRVKTAEYVKSSVDLKHCPPPKYPEFAVIGRSNVGKSSLINSLTGKQGLAMVSKTPGKTKTINHFLINNSWYLVDLPGYGYAQTVSQDKKMVWNEFTREYFLQRETLVNVLLLVDASIPPQQVDVDCVNWLGDSEVPFTVVFTKMDKRKKKVPRPEDNIKAFTDIVLQSWETLPRVMQTSSRTGDGGRDVLAYLSQLRELYNQNKL